MEKKYQRAGKKKRKRACQTAEKTKSTSSFSELFFLMFREKKYGTRSMHAKKAKNARKAKIVEATKNRGRLAEREAGAYNQAIFKKKDKRKYIYSCRCCLVDTAICFAALLIRSQGRRHRFGPNTLRTTVLLYCRSTRKTEGIRTRPQAQVRIALSSASGTTYCHAAVQSSTAFPQQSNI